MTKPEGRTQLVGYAVAHGLAKATEARKTDLELLRRIVTVHREVAAVLNRTNEPSATTAEKKERT
jgi:hypothetical protein